jgi:hypothetical protein
MFPCQRREGAPNQKKIKKLAPKAELKPYWNAQAICACIELCIPTFWLVAWCVTIPEKEGGECTAQNLVKSSIGAVLSANLSGSVLLARSALAELNFRDMGWFWVDPGIALWHSGNARGPAMACLHDWELELLSAAR